MEEPKKEPTEQEEPKKEPTEEQIRREKLRAAAERRMRKKDEARRKWQEQPEHAVPLRVNIWTYKFRQHTKWTLPIYILADILPLSIFAVADLGFLKE